MESSCESSLTEQAFFTNCQQELKKIAADSRTEQEKLRRIKKIQKMRREAELGSQRLASKMLDNIMIDYLRSHNLNYTYTVFMRERNLLSSEVQLKPSLV